MTGQHCPAFAVFAVGGNKHIFHCDADVLSEFWIIQNDRLSGKLGRQKCFHRAQRSGFRNGGLTDGVPTASQHQGCEKYQNQGRSRLGRMERWHGGISLETGIRPLLVTCSRHGLRRFTKNRTRPPIRITGSSPVPFPGQDVFLTDEFSAAHLSSFNLSAALFSPLSAASCSNSLALTGSWRTPWLSR